ncbi:cold-shock protein [Actinomadura roseirufa]|uniref:cold-shock protein n=1 Tax=Actinomadura roseirufa TaxID=2094049 RepID=UPI0010413E19|nr:cold shock domain-containing protein [Actinomadura roseirufa]
MSGTPVHGTVRSWDDEAGWGTLASSEVPGDVWAHFSAVHMSEEGAFARLVPGEDVVFTWEEAEQDGYAYRATDVRRPGDPPPGPDPDDHDRGDGATADATIDVRIDWDRD